LGRYTNSVANLGNLVANDALTFGPNW